MFEEDAQLSLNHLKRQDVDRLRGPRLILRHTRLQVPLLAEQWRHPRSQSDHSLQQHLHQQEEVSHFEKIEDLCTHLREKEAHQYTRVFVDQITRLAGYFRLLQDRHEARHQLTELLLAAGRENKARVTVEVAKLVGR